MTIILSYPTTFVKYIIGIMITSSRHTVRHQSGFALVVVFVLGLVAGALVGPQVSGKQWLASAAPAGGTLTDTGAPPAGFEATQLPRGSHLADVLRVLDGDTFEARVHVWP